ncbi:MAG: MoxR-like ATPase [Planctomycetota bacterium]|jgi:MoxR-like ATPase
MTDTQMIAERIEQFRSDVEKLRIEIAKVIVGQNDLVNDVIVGIFSGGHILLEGVPGLGKTLLVKTLARAVDLPFSRVQFTPDLMPADITGTNIVVEDESGRRNFKFQQGPIFASVVLADEINRATPKTQSALLEAMQEATCTVSGVRHVLPQPFFVLATQNPIDMEGTYPLPEAQLDRFLFKLSVKFPSKETLMAIFTRTTTNEETEVHPVLKGERILEMRSLAREVLVAEAVYDYVATIIMATHPESPSAPSEVRRFLRFGASPRGGQSIILAAKVRALMDGRHNVAFDDIARCTIPSLRHRLILNFEGEAENKTTDDVLTTILETIKP